MARAIEGFDGIGQQAAVTAGTPYTVPLRARKGCKSCLDSLIYTAAGTAHTATLLRAQGRTTLSAAAAASQAVIALTADPGAGLTTPNPIAANDWLIIRRSSDNVLIVAKVASVSTLNITLSASLSVALRAGDEVYFFGVPADTDPDTGLPMPSYALPASATTTIANTTGNGLVSSSRMGEPLLLHIDNVTAAGTLVRVTWLQVFEPGSPFSPLMGAVGEHHDTPEAVLGGAIAGLPWGSIVGAILKLLQGGSTPAPSQPASPWGGLFTKLAGWLAGVIGQQAPPVPQVPTTAGR